jgi:hypothetical protein
MSALSEFGKSVKELAVGAADVVEFAAEETPVIGTIVHGAEATYDLGAAAIDGLCGDDKARHAHITDMVINVAEAIPLVGTALGAGQLTNDLQHAEDTTHDQVHDLLYPEGSPGRDLENPPKYEPVPNTVDGAAPPATDSTSAQDAG